MSKPADVYAETLRRLIWLADAPMFIDEELVGRFFDAVVQPVYDRELIVRGKKESSEVAKTISATLGGKVRIPPHSGH